MFQTSSPFANFGSSKDWNIRTMFKNDEITPMVQQHLVRVYLTFACALVAVGAGVLLDLTYNLGGLLSFFGSIGLIFWLSSVPPQYESKRLGILCGFGICTGLNLGDLVFLALNVDSTILISALATTTVIFLSFSMSALLAKRREYLYLGGLLSSAMSLLFLLSFLNIFFRSVMMYTVHLYLGLLVFCGYVIFDTQLIIEKASLGDFDYIMHAMTLLVDFVGIFVRILVILLRNASDKEDDRRRRRG